LIPSVFDVAVFEEFLYNEKDSILMIADSSEDILRTLLFIQNALFAANMHNSSSDEFLSRVFKSGLSLGACSIWFTNHLALL
jgi:hypothetical protein